MAGRSSVVGAVRIRQVYSRQGRTYCAVSIPIAIMDLMGWKPGQYLSYYPAKGGGLKLVLHTDSFAAQYEDFDQEKAEKGDEVRGPRPGSIAAREKEVEAEHEGWIEDAHGRLRVDAKLALDPAHRNRGGGHQARVDAILARMEERAENAVKKAGLRGKK